MRIRIDHAPGGESRTARSTYIGNGERERAGEGERHTPAEPAMATGILVERQEPEDARRLSELMG